jgi:MFS family permease
MSTGISAPLVPLMILVTLGGGAAEAAIAAVVTSAVGVPSAALWGRLSDGSGRRRPFLVLGFGGTGVGMLLLALAPDVLNAYLGALVIGTFATASAAAGPALIMETAPEREWATRIAEYSRVCSSGWLGGLIIGAGWLLVFHDPGGMRGLAGLATVLGVVGALGAGRWISESRPGGAGRPRTDALLRLDAHVIERYRYIPSRMLHFRFWKDEVATLRALPGRHPLWILLAALALLFTGFVLFYTVLPAYLALVVGSDPGPVFIVYAGSSAASALFYPWAGRVVERAGARRSVTIAATARVPLFLTFPLVLAVWQGGPIVYVFAALNAVAGIFWTLISVGATVAVTELAPTSKAEAVGAFHAVQGVGAIAGAAIAASLVGSFGFSGLIALSALLIMTGVVFALASRPAGAAEVGATSTRPGPQKA